MVGEAIGEDIPGQKGHDFLEDARAVGMVVVQLTADKLVRCGVGGDQGRKFVNVLEMRVVLLQAIEAGNHEAVVVSIQG